MTWKLVFLVSCFLGGINCEIHSLAYQYTVSSQPKDRPEFELTMKFDEDIISHCDSKEQKNLPRQDWVKEVMSEVELESRHKWCQYEHQVHKAALITILELTNSTAGILQRQRSCSVSTDGSVASRSDQWGLNGEDFLTFNETTLTWRSDSPKALSTEQKWNQKTLMNQMNKIFIQQKCHNLLSRLVTKREERIRCTVPEVHIFAKFVPERRAVSLRCQVVCCDPAGLQVRLTRGGEVVADGSMKTGPLPNTDGTVQLRLTADISPIGTRGYLCEIRSNTGNISVTWDGFIYSGKPTEPTPSKMQWEIGNFAPFLSLIVLIPLVLIIVQCKERRTSKPTDVDANLIKWFVKIRGSIDPLLNMVLGTSIIKTAECYRDTNEQWEEMVKIDDEFYPSQKNRYITVLSTDSEC